MPVVMALAILNPQNVQPSYYPQNRLSHGLFYEPHSCRMCSWRLDPALASALFKLKNTAKKNHRSRARQKHIKIDYLIKPVPKGIMRDSSRYYPQPTDLALAEASFSCQLRDTFTDEESWEAVCIWRVTPVSRESTTAVYS